MSKMYIASDTVGVCLASELPACYSQRERLFIVENIVTDFKEIFTAMEQLMGYRLNIDVSGKLSNNYYIYCLMKFEPGCFFL